MYSSLEHFGPCHAMHRYKCFPGLSTSGGIHYLLFAISAAFESSYHSRPVLKLGLSGRDLLFWALRLAEPAWDQGTFRSFLPLILIFTSHILQTYLRNVTLSVCAYYPDFVNAWETHFSYDTYFVELEYGTRKINQSSGEPVRMYVWPGDIYCLPSVPAATVRAPHQDWAFLVTCMYPSRHCIPKVSFNCYRWTLAKEFLCRLFR